MRSKDYRSNPITRSPHACPKCGSIQVRRSRSRLVHLYRVLQNSRKRYCVNCGERWSASLLPQAPTLLRAKDLVVPGLVLAGLLLFVLITWVERRQSGRIKAGLKKVVEKVQAVSRPQGD
ncbi:MAG TPA: hypothetical protein DCM05_11500 [Elusimicrobia bacterium]|nr:hypothetical protein [Elusimicrobiota bacterium]